MSEQQTNSNEISVNTRRFNYALSAYKNGTHVGVLYQTRQDIEQKTTRMAIIAECTEVDGYPGIKLFDLVPKDIGSNYASSWILENDMPFVIGLLTAEDIDAALNGEYAISFRHYLPHEHPYSN